MFSILSSANKIAGLKELYVYALAFLLAAFGASLSPREASKTFSYILAAGCLVGLLALYQYFFGFKRVLEYLAKEKVTNEFALDYLERKRVFLPFVTPNALAGYLIMIVPLALPHRKRRLLLVLPCIALLLTKSLGALVSIFFALCFFSSLKGAAPRKTLWILAVVLAITVAIFAVRFASPGQHLKPSFSAAMRLSYWKETWLLIKTSWVTGVGPGNFNLLYSRYAHNSYLQMWAEIGVGGIAAFMWMVFIFFKEGMKKTNYSEECSLYRGIITAGAAFLIHNVVDFTLFLPEISYLWWITLGVAASAKRSGPQR